ncbi:MAG: bifunctional phosphoribosylaminoimidazolecarboxamide formyltransferase/IMP cyclohydrolase [Christensenellales bacterium]
MKRAFLSVFDKTGIEEFARGLNALGFEIISTGGTRRALERAGLPVISVSDITGFPECLGGRVKTLHPKIHAGILAMRENDEHMAQVEKLGVGLIDIVAVNLYPFKAAISKTNAALEDAIENIDIGGPTMLRAAAKNWRDVASIADPSDYGRVLEELKSGGISEKTKFELCVKVFEHTAAYDALISGYLRRINGGGYPDKLTLTFEKAQDMRYGENPHQSAAFYREPLRAAGTLADAKQLWGKELSFNNINDANGALECLKEFSEPAVVAVKHANPCGVGCAENIYDAYRKAYDADPMSIYGGIAAANRAVDKKTAELMAKVFLEIVIAPDFTNEALDVLKAKKNLRILRIENISDKTGENALDIKKPRGGLLVQQCDTPLTDGRISVVTKTTPDEKQTADLMFAWKVVKHIKSNGIAVAKDGQTLGLGPGQVSRVWAAKDALMRAGEKAKGAVLASDAFFPFDDCVRLAAEFGISAIIQPGGSIRDEDSVKACDELGISMVFTNMRHFKH